MGAWTEDGAGQRNTQPIDPEVNNRYGVVDLLDLYPNRDRQASVEFAFETPTHACHYLIEQISRSHPHLLSKRLTRLNNPNQAADDALRERFSRIVYFGPHRNLVNDGAVSNGYYDLSIGTAFISEWDSLKNGNDSEHGRSALQAERLIAQILDWQSVSINASSDKKQLLLTRDSKRFSISELGSGIAELVLCLISAAVKKPTWILIDEPESHLHPALQAKFIETLELLASEGVVFTTHSVGLARTSADTALVVEQDKLGRSSLHPLGAVRSFSELMGEMSFSQHHELGFNKLLLCEGVTEIKTFRQILRKWNLDSSVMIIPLGGDALINPARHDELQEFNRFGVPVFVLVDSERDSTDTSIPQRSKFIDLCKKLFGEKNAIQTARRATENYFTADAIKTAMRSEKYAPLDLFQKSQSVSLFWGKDQNWKIAAEMSKDDWLATDLGQFFEILAQP